MLPQDISCVKEAKDIIVECCVGPSSLFPTKITSDRRVGTEWVKLLSTQANAVCDGSSKKTISPEHVTEALRV